MLNWYTCSCFDNLIKLTNKQTNFTWALGVELGEERGGGVKGKQINIHKQDRNKLLGGEGWICFKPSLFAKN